MPTYALTSSPTQIAAAGQSWTVVNNGPGTVTFSDQTQTLGPGSATSARMAAGAITATTSTTASVTVSIAPAYRLGANAVSYMSGFWYSAAGTRGVSSRPNGFMTVLPFEVQRPTTFDRMAIEVTTAGEAGSQVRLGIYPLSNGVPGDLLLDAGQVATSSTGFKPVTISQTLGAGWYGLAALTQAATTTQPTCRSINAPVNVLGAPIATTGDTVLTGGAGFSITAAGQAGLPANGFVSIPADTALVVALRAV